MCREGDACSRKRYTCSVGLYRSFPSLLYVDTIHFHLPRFYRNAYKTVQKDDPLERSPNLYAEDSRMNMIHPSYRCALEVSVLLCAEVVSSLGDPVILHGVEKFSFTIDSASSMRPIASQG